MNLSGSGAVVTGGGNGIGRDFARRLAAGGARVVVNDLDAAAATAVADEIGGSAVPADVSTERASWALVAAAVSLGEIDVYCSNAGIAAGDTARRRWHGRDLAALLGGERDGARPRGTPAPAGWLGRRSGRMVIASAAGLLTMLGHGTIFGDQACGRRLRRMGSP